MERLTKGAWYNISGKGKGIYCGLSLRKNMSVFRLLDCPLSAVYINSEFANKLRPLAKQPNELPALILNNRARLSAQEVMFFENSSGIHCGLIESISGDNCALNVGGIVKDVHLRNLFTYDNLYQTMPARVIPGQSLPCKRDIYQKQHIPNIRCGEV